MLFAFAHPGFTVVGYRFFRKPTLNWDEQYYIIFKNNPRVPRAAAARCALAAGKKTRRIPVLDPVHAARAAHT